MKPPRPKIHHATQYAMSPTVAYAVGLITTDGNLSKDGRHIDLTSKDRKQLLTFMRCLGFRARITTKISGFTGTQIPRLQFSNVRLYRFLVSIGLTPAKTKTLAGLNIPDEYFFDFLRGHLDGDGHFYSYWDTRWPNSFMFYLVFNSGSERHIAWLRRQNDGLLGIHGHITNDRRHTTYHLKYAKREALLLLRKMYYDSNLPCLERKRLKIIKALTILKLALYQ